MSLMYCVKNFAINYNNESFVSIDNWLISKRSYDWSEWQVYFKTFHTFIYHSNNNNDDNYNSSSSHNNFPNLQFSIQHISNNVVPT